MKDNPLFGLLRHGETQWNVLGRIQGARNSPLTDNGKAETRKWLTTLKQWRWDRIYASDLGRVQQTAEILNCELQLPLDFDPGLREQNWGLWEGATLTEIKETQKEELQRQVARGWEFTPPLGESRSGVRRRAFSALTRIAQKHRGENVLILCHQGIIKIILYHLSKSSFLPGENPQVERNNLHLISWTGNEFVINRMNIDKGMRL